MSHFSFDETRIEERAKLIELGVNPYPHNYKPSHDLVDLRERSEELMDSEVCVAGRLTSLRGMGKAKFADIQDLAGHIQIYFKKNIIGDDAWEMAKNLTTGDLVGAVGKVMTTRTGELTVAVSELTVLAKTTVPIPISKEKDGQKFYALSDPEIRFRERYLDWITDGNSRARFVMRSKILSEIRRFMGDNDFLEVETPIIESCYGGGEADPFVTHASALGNQEMYLRISLEIPLKKYIAGGFPRVFALGSTFRNEGIDRSHHPEFSLMEWYEAYSDYEDQMVRFENLVSHVAKTVTGGTEVTYNEMTTDLKTPWRRITIADAIKDKTGLDVNELEADVLLEECKKLEVEDDATLPSSWGECVVFLFEHACEAELLGPVFVTDFPVDVSPLTKRKRLPDGSISDRWVERFEPYIFGMELGNSYTELTDPVEQLERLEAQSRTERGLPVDYDFVKAVACGLPPTGGVGIGIDRLVMILTGASTVRDIIAFPMMRRLKDGETSEEQRETEENKDGAE